MEWATASATSGHPSDAELLDTLIAGKYRVLRRIGSGSTGAVYQCKHVGLDKLVALKILHREMVQNTGFVERFKREAQAASRLEHPNSVRVLDFGQDERGTLYIVMEYIEGRDLLRVLDEDGPFSAERAVDVMSQILDALAVAHSLGIVHRDLKPENILVRTVNVDGFVREVVTVCDFGIAQLSPIRLAGSISGSTSVSVTDQGMVVGTPAYMSPEQARAEVQDARSDIYSAGVVLFQLLTLTVPFSADTVLGVAVKHCSEPPPRPSLFGAVNPAIELVCLKALSKFPDDRYQSAREMRQALVQAVAVQSGQTRRQTPIRWPTSRLPLPSPPLATPPSLFPIETPVLETGEFVPSVWQRLKPALIGLSVVGLVALLPALLRVFSEPALPAHAANPPQLPAPSPVAAAAPATPAPVAEEHLETWTAAAVPGVRNEDTAFAINAEKRNAADADFAAAATNAKHKRAASAPAAQVAVGSAVAPQTHVIEKVVSIAAVASSPASRALEAEPVPAALVIKREPDPMDELASEAFSPPREAAFKAPRRETLTSNAAQATPPVIEKEVLETLPPNPARATVSIDALTTRAVSKAGVRGALNMDAMTACYRSALRSGSGPISTSKAQLELATNMAGGVSNVVVRGAFAEGLRECIEQVARRARVRDVDTGSAQASVTLLFTPR
jgi:serine/threonine protein kinase